MATGVSHRRAIGPSAMTNARHFRVSPKFVNDRVKLKRTTGSPDPRRQGNPRRGKPSGHDPWVMRLPMAHPGPTLDAIRDALAAEQGLRVHRASVGGWLHRLGLSHKGNFARQRDQAACGGQGAPHLAGAAPALHAQPAGKTDLHRCRGGKRDRSGGSTAPLRVAQDHHGQDHRLGPVRGAADRSRALWPLDRGAGRHRFEGRREGRPSSPPCVTTAPTRPG